MKKFGVLLVGIIFIAVGIFMYYKNEYLTKNCTEEATATVVGMKEDYEIEDGNTRYIYYPIIEYNANEKTTQTTLESGSNPPSYSVNDKIEILYNPNKVEEFKLKDDKTSSIITYVIIGLGIVISICGIVVIFKKN